MAANRYTNMGTLSLSEFECEIRVQVLDGVRPTKTNAHVPEGMFTALFTAGLGFHECFESRRVYKVRDWSYHACDDVREHR